MSIDTTTHVAEAFSAATAAESGTTVLADGLPEELVTEELLVEEISIDGMCGVY